MTDNPLSKKRFVAQMLSGSPADCMEVAKKIIGRQIPVNNVTLAKIAQDKSLSIWQRKAAIYSLGFLGEAKCAQILGDVVSDLTEDLSVRSHAAEALGNIGEKRMVGLLKNILALKPPEELQESCRYALDELDA